MPGRNGTTKRETSAVASATGKTGVGETLMILSAMRDRPTFLRLASVLTENHFQAEFKLIRQSLGKYWEKNRTDQEAEPNGLQLLLQKVSGRKWELIEPHWRRMLALPVRNAEAVEKHLDAYIKTEAMRRLVLEVSDGLDKGNLGDPLQYARDLRDLSAALTRKDQRQIQYDRAPLKYWDALTVGRIPSGIAGLDEAMRGGLGPGELGILLAPPNVGKTNGLVNIGAVALMTGKRVYHVSMEINQNEVLLRYDMCLGGLTDAEIQDERRLRAARTKVRAAGGNLVIEDLSHERLTPLGLESRIEGLDPGPDLLVFDYGDLLRSDRHYEEGRYAIGDVYRELRRLASLFRIPIWTASQATREALRKGTFGTEETAEDISKIHTADYVVCLCQTPRQRTMSEMSLNLGKGRGKSHRPNVRMTTDWDRLQWREYEDPGDRSVSQGNRPRGDSGREPDLVRLGTNKDRAPGRRNRGSDLRPDPGTPMSDSTDRDRATRGSKTKRKGQLPPGETGGGTTPVLPKKAAASDQPDLPSTGKESTRNRNWVYAPGYGKHKGDGS